MSSYPLCIQHQLSPMQFVEVTSESANWICSSCLCNDLQQRKPKSKILDLFELKQNPHLLQNIFQENFMEFHCLYQVINQFQKEQENLLNKMKTLIEIVNTLIVEIQSLIDKLKVFDLEIKKIENDTFNIQKFNELIKNLWNSQTKLNQDIKQQFELQFFSCISSLLNPLELQENLSRPLWSLRQQILLQYQFSEKFDKLENLIKVIREEDEKIFNPIIFFHQISINQAKAWAMIQVEMIEKKKIKQELLVYEGKKNQPYTSELIQKIKGKKNTLMIFYSKNKGGTVFGAYAPYEWAIGQYSGDEINNTSFLFQFNQKKIYTKKKENAKCTQYIDTRFILFGGNDSGDQDLLLFLNDQIGQGYSQLGQGFKALEVDSSKKTDVLFGDIQPNIEECQVFELSLI